MSNVASEVVEIKLNDGLTAIIDAEDYERVSKHRWTARKGGRCAYTNMMMHRLIIDAPQGVEVDHANGDPLDNRKENLRLCTRSQNIANTRKPRRKKGCQSVFKGVCRHKKSKKWVASVQPGGKSYRRYCDTEVEAALAYDEMARQHFGEFARLNFPDSEVEPDDSR